MSHNHTACTTLMLRRCCWPPSLRHSYGLVRAEFIATLINSVGLLVLVAWLVVTAVERLQTPQPVMSEVSRFSRY